MPTYQRAGVVATLPKLKVRLVAFNLYAVIEINYILVKFIDRG